MQATIRVTIQAAGLTISGYTTRTADGGTPREVTLPAAKAGNLTTRTSDTAGTLTLAADHGITDGQKIDIFWIDADGVSHCAFGATVGTVAGTSVPFTGASGDVLPADEYAITAAVQVSIDVEFDLADGQLLAAVSTKLTHLDFQQANGSSLADQLLTAAEPWSWLAGQAVDPPFTGTTCQSIKVANGNSAAAATLKLVVLHDTAA